MQYTASFIQTLYYHPLVSKEKYAFAIAFISCTYKYCSYILAARLLLLRQIPISPALLINSSRKSGWAMEISASALCHKALPFKEAIPYSVTMLEAMPRWMDTAEPGARAGRIRENTLPPLLKVEVMQTKPFPPFDLKEPWAKQIAPPVPLICRTPEDSELIWPKRSTSIQLLIDINLSS